MALQFGFAFQREALEPAPPSNAIMSVVGLCAPMTKATGVQDSDFTGAFPLNTPVMFNTTDAMARMIDPLTPVGDAISALNSQLGKMQRSARVIVTRVDEGTNQDPAAKYLETAANIIGNSSTGTGLYSFKKAGAIVGCYPRLVACPGYTSQMPEDADVNPIAAALPPILNSYLGVAVVDAPGTNEADAITYREGIASDRIIVCEPDVKVLEAGVIVRRPLSPRILGIAVRRDFEYEGRPSHSWANQPVYGIVAPGRYIDFSLTDGSTEGQDLLGHQVGVLVRGESGDDFAIADGGFVAVVYENCDEASGGIWQQLHKTRMRDFIELTALRTLRYYLGKFNLTTHTIQVIVNVISDILTISQSKGDILGFVCRFDPDTNNPDDLRQGHIYIDARFEEAPMFRMATIESRPHRPALDATIAALTASTVLV